MFWSDKIAKQVIESKEYTPYWVDDMKTPSGRIHVGSLRGILIHELVWRSLRDAGKNPTMTWVYDNQDPMDALPHYLEKGKWEKYLGQPLFTVPSPEEGANNYAEFYANEFTKVFNKLGCHPQILWSSDLYMSGKLNDDIRLCLDKTDIIRGIYEELYKKKMEETWHPFQVVCPKCGKESTTRVYKWDGELVHFVCKVDAVDWTKGCGYEGKISPLSTVGHYAGKLSWKVEWPVKWKAIGITIEGAGKDHMSAGGSHDVAKLVCERVLKYPVPYPVGYEFFLIGGKKMSSSKGLGSSAKEVSDIIPPYLTRFLFTRTDYKQAIEFEPIGTMAIPDLFDEYDRCWKEYNSSGEKDLSRAFELSQLDEIPEKKPSLFIPRFRDVVNYIQNTPLQEIQKKFSEQKGKELTDEELIVLKERIDYAAPWISKYAPEEFRFSLDTINESGSIMLSEKQKEFLSLVVPLLDIYNNVDQLNVALYEKAKELKIDTKEAFQAIYLSLIGKKHGPKAAWFLLSSPKEEVVKRIEHATEIKKENQTKTKNIFLNPEIFIIDEHAKEKNSSLSVGVAVIKNVSIKKTDPELEKEKEEFLKNLESLTTEELGKYPEIISYRKLYKEMGIDWHSRRPSPEALLRRIALKKGLYSINTCVDAYNLIVMKHRISVGAFDMDKLEFPTILRYAKNGEEIHLLGDDTPTKYTDKELAYFDQNGGYNIDFNYRDAKRTAVSLETKNIILNVDGIYDVTPEKVGKTLNDAVEIIQKYCGGSLELKGIVI